MAIGVAALSLVSPLGLCPSEHVLFFRAEVHPHTSGAFTTPRGEALPVHHCPWIPAARPLASRLRLLAKQALARARPASPRTPVLLIAPEAMDGDADVARFLALSGHAVVRVLSGSAAYVFALQQAREMLMDHAEVVVLAVDSLLSRHELERWLDERYSAFTRNPLPPSEGAAAMRLVRTSGPAPAGVVHAFAAERSEATDDNDLPTDGAALTRAFTKLGLPGRVPLVVGPRDVDPLRSRDFHLAAVRHYQALDRAEMPSLEGCVGLFGSAAGLMSAVFALAWLRHGLPLPDPEGHRVALSWARSRDGCVGAVLVGTGAVTTDRASGGARKASLALQTVPANPPLLERDPPTIEREWGALEWQGSVRLAADQAAGISAATWHQHVRTGLLERVIVLGADHREGAHVDRPEIGRRLLAHIDALAEAGLSLAEISAFAEGIELERPGALWALTLLFGCLDLSGAEDALESWVAEIEVSMFASYRGVLEIAEALAIQPNSRLRRRAAQWVDSASDILCAIAVESMPAEELTDGRLQRLSRMDSPLIQAALERLSLRAPRETRRPASRHDGWLEWSAPALSYEVSRARISRGDLEPLLRLRARDARVVSALGPHVIDVLALAGEGGDDDLAGELVRGLPTTPGLVSAMGRAGLPSLMPRLIAELDGDDLDEDAHRALTTALGPRATRPSARAWESAAADLLAVTDTRLRGGQPHMLRSVIEEMMRPDLSEEELRVRADEVFVKTGQRIHVEWGAFGMSLDKALSELARRVR